MNQAFPTQTTSVLGGISNTGGLGLSQGGVGSYPPYYSAPIKVLPTHATVRLFTGTDHDYPAREFISMCEDVMVHACIHDPSDQIAYVRSNIKPNSAAFRLLHARFMRQPLLQKDYAAFKANFLSHFGENTGRSLVRGINASVDRLLAGANSQDQREALGDSTRISEDMIRFLEENHWTSNGVMTVEHVRKSYEFFAYMALLKRRIRKKSLALVFEPTEEVYDFANKLTVKLEDNEGDNVLPGSKSAS